MLIQDRLQVRDWEILRTLGRCQFVPTRQLVGAFFGTASATRRRLARLSDWDLIKAHSKGTPPGLRYSAWRLTPEGARVLSVGFPGDALPEGAASRLAEQSLLNLEHRESLTRLYLKVLVGSENSLPPRDIRRRGDAFSWKPDGTIVLRYRDAAGEHVVIPDATAHSRARGARIFIELDRATRERRRISEGLARYRQYFCEAYERDFPDGTKPTVLFVVGSARRREGLGALAAQHLEGVAGHESLLFDDAVHWLRSAILGETSDAAAAPSFTPLERAARDVYESARGYREELQSRGGDLPASVRAALRTLHRVLTEGEQDGP